MRWAGAPANLGSPGPGIGWARAQRRLGMVEDQDAQDVDELSEDDVDELLVEEVSIDGMCGVY